MPQLIQITGVLAFIFVLGIGVLSLKYLVVYSKSRTFALSRKRFDVRVNCEAVTTGHFSSLRLPDAIRDKSGYPIRPRRK